MVAWLIDRGLALGIKEAVKFGSMLLTEGWSSLSALPSSPALTPPPAKSQPIPGWLEPLPGFDHVFLNGEYLYSWTTLANEDGDSASQSFTDTDYDEESGESIIDDDSDMEGSDWSSFSDADSSSAMAAVGRRLSAQSGPAGSTRRVHFNFAACTYGETYSKEEYERPADYDLEAALEEWEFEEDEVWPWRGKGGERRNFILIHPPPPSLPRNASDSCKSAGQKWKRVTRKATGALSASRLVVVGARLPNPSLSQSNLRISCPRTSPSSSSSSPNPPPTHTTPPRPRSSLKTSMAILRCCAKRQPCAGWR